MRYIELPDHDPAFNLALEETLLDELPESGDGIFLLWQNDPSVIIGRHQVTSEVIERIKVEAEKLPVVRRISGGGAVYHDRGNLNFSFIENAGSSLCSNFRRYLAPVVAALADLGMKAEISGRNDLEISGRKISGSSQILRARKVLHHGTLLFNADLSALESFLRVDAGKYNSKGIRSQKARVANLLEFSVEPFTVSDLKEALIRHCAQEKAHLAQRSLAAAEELATAKYRTWAWNYGKSPKFDLKKSHRFTWGEVAIYLQISDGIIRECRIGGDFFSSSDIEQLAGAFVGQPFTSAALVQALGDCDWRIWFTGCEPEAMRSFFFEQLFS